VGIRVDLVRVNLGYELTVNDKRSYSERRVSIVTIARTTKKPTKKKRLIVLGERYCVMLALSFVVCPLPYVVEPYPEG